MKRLVYILTVCLIAVLVTACRGDDITGVEPVHNGKNIILDLSAGDMHASRSGAEGAEQMLRHVDVLIFNTDGSQKWYERTSVTGTGQVVLGISRDAFAAGTSYYVYVIANSTADMSEFRTADLNTLAAMSQTDSRIHVTGVRNVTGAPQAFLMDGIAFKHGDSEPEHSEGVVINGADADTELDVILRRAAAKIQVIINKGASVTFSSGAEAATEGYYLKNMPYSTSVVAGVNGKALLRTPDKAAGEYYQREEEQIVVTAYAYANNWADESAMEQELRMVVNIPMVYDGVYKASNYYQIPVSREKKTERNMCYKVIVTVNTPGAENPSEPIELKDISYSTEPWTERTINVGGTEAKPVYLTLNEEKMNMHNTDEDNTTLQFVSSSDVSTRITSVYYYDKFGQKMTLTANAISRLGIKVTPDAGMTGKIDVYSPVPVNNAVRYIEIEVTNEDGVTPRRVMVTQYPLEYITNIQGWYSYRSDFGGTTYEKRGPNRYVSCARNGSQWSYSSSNNGRNDFFRSNVAVEKTSGSDRGKSDIYTYSWARNALTPTHGNEVGVNNARMYHVQIKASSGEYTLGKPRLTEGKTDSGADNNKLVSPSFMIASQLGAVFSRDTGINYEMAASHCEQYVEVYKDAKTGETIALDDWRLPTRAEIEIIKKFQDTPDAAMDRVLAGQNYYCADKGTVTITNSENEGTFLRCIRDAYSMESTGK